MYGEVFSQSEHWCFEGTMGVSVNRFDYNEIKFPPMRDLEFLTGHVTFKLQYNQI